VNSAQMRPRGRGFGSIALSSAGVLDLQMGGKLTVLSGFIGCALARRREGEQGLLRAFDKTEGANTTNGVRGNTPRYPLTAQFCMCL